VSTNSFRRELKTFLFDSVYGHQETDRLWTLPVKGAIQMPRLLLLLTTLSGEGSGERSQVAEKQRENPGTEGQNAGRVSDEWGRQELAADKPATVADVDDDPEDSGSNATLNHSRPTIG